MLWMTAVLYLSALLFVVGCSTASDDGDDIGGEQAPFLQHELPLPTALPLRIVGQSSWDRTEFVSMNGNRYSVSHPAHWSVTQADRSLPVRINPLDDSDVMEIMVRSISVNASSVDEQDSLTKFSEIRLLELQRQLPDLRVLDATRLNTDGFDSILVRYTYAAVGEIPLEAFELHAGSDNLVLTGTYPDSLSHHERLRIEAVARSLVLLAE